MRGQQVAFDLVGKKRQAALPRLPAGHLLALGLEALGNPAGQLFALNRLDGDVDAVRIQRGEPGGFFAGRVQARQVHQGEHLLRLGGLLGQLRQGGGPFFATGFAAGDAQLNDLLVGKQTERTARRQHRTPVKVGPLHGEHAALGKTGGAGRSADGIGGLLQLQRLIAVQGVERAQPLGQVARQLVQGQLHCDRGAGARAYAPTGGCTSARRRSSCWATSWRMSRTSSISSSSLARVRVSL